MWSLLRLTVLVLSIFSNRIVNGECEVYLPQLTPSTKYTCPGCHLGGFGVNEWHGNTEMIMGDGNSYDEFLVIHPGGTQGIGFVEYQLNGDFDDFSGIIGQANPSNGCENSNVFDFEFKIYVDGNLQVTSETITDQSQYENIAVDVRGGNILRVETHTLGLATCDHATIAAPKLTSSTNCCCTNNVDKAKYHKRCKKFLNEQKCLKDDDTESGEKQCQFMYCPFVNGLCRIDPDAQRSKGTKEKKECRAKTNEIECEMLNFCNWTEGVTPNDIDEEIEMFKTNDLSQNHYVLLDDPNILLFLVIIIGVFIAIFYVNKYWKDYRDNNKIINSSSEKSPLLINLQ